MSLRDLTCVAGNISCFKSKVLSTATEAIFVWHGMDEGCTMGWNYFWRSIQASKIESTVHYTRQITALMHWAGLDQIWTLFDLWIHFLAFKIRESCLFGANFKIWQVQQSHLPAIFVIVFVMAKTNKRGRLYVILFV